MAKKYKSKINSSKKKGKIKYNNGGIFAGKKTNYSTDFTGGMDLNQVKVQGTGGGSSFDVMDNMEGQSAAPDTGGQGDGLAIAGQVAGTVAAAMPAGKGHTNPTMQSANESGAQMQDAMGNIPVVGAFTNMAHSLFDPIVEKKQSEVQQTNQTGRVENRDDALQGQVGAMFANPFKGLSMRMETGNWGVGKEANDKFIRTLEAPGREKWRQSENTRKNDYLNSVGEEGVFANGGQAGNKESELVEFFGPSHAEGGINIGGGQEVEGGETAKDGFIFSDRIGYDKKGQPTWDAKKTKMTFADKTKKIDKQFKGRTDEISTRTKDYLNKRIENDAKKVGPIADAKAGNPSHEGKFFFGNTLDKEDNFTEGMEFMQMPVLGNQSGDPAIDAYNKRPPISSTPNFDPKGVQFTPQAGFNTKDQNTSLFGNSAQKGAPAPVAQKGAAPVDNSKIGLTQGDYLNMASSLPAIGYNFGKGFQNATEDDLNLNPEANKIKGMMAGRNINFQPINNELTKERTAGVRAIGDNTRSVGSRNANLQGLFANVADKKAGLEFKEQDVNNKYRAEEAGVLNNLGQQESRERLRKMTADQQHRAVKESFIGQGFSELGEGMKNAGNALNTNVKNNMTMKNVNALSTRYRVDKGTIKALMSGGMTEADIIKYYNNKK